MTYIHKTSASLAALSIFMTSSPAFADVSAQQVWGDWKSYMEGFGYSVQSTESASGGTLSVNDITMSMTLPEGAGDFTMSVPEMTFSDNGDGSVTVQIPPVMPLTMSMNTPDAEDVDIALDYLTQGFGMTVSGDANAMTYDYSADELSMVLKELVVEGDPVDLGTANFTMSDLAGATLMKMGNLRTTTQKMTTGAASYALDLADPEGDGRFVMNGNFASMGFEGSGSFPTEMDASDMDAMLKAGFGFDGVFDYKSGSSSFNFQEDGETVQAVSSTDNGKLTVTMDASQLMYNGAANNMKMQMAGGELPFPVEIAMAQSGFNLKMPVAKSDQDQDVEFGITLGDFTMSDMIWGMFDPAGKLPRDPATIALDLAGKVNLMVDIFDPAQMEAVEDGDVIPANLQSLNINNLVLRAVGAELTGTGAFTFNNEDFDTFDGIPAPDGSVDLKLVGGNGLIDKLVALGFLPEDQANMGRMMLGMFAVPGDGEDTLNSKIEVKGDGQIMANGQRLQ